MTKIGSEERYPLLLLYVEENGRKSEFPQRVVFADKGRGKDVANGVAAIITRWPAQVTSCWLTSIVLATTFIFLAFVILMSSLNPMSFPIHPRCTRDFNSLSNKTIHLVKHGNNWTQKELNILKFIADTFPDFKIRNIMLETSMKNFKKREKMKETSTERPHFHFMQIPDFTTSIVKKLNEILKDPTESKEDENSGTDHPEDNVIPTPNSNITIIKRMKRHLSKPPKSYDDLLEFYPNIEEAKTTFKNYFTNTPLHYFWPDYSPEMLLFSVQVLELWQNGGISFYLPSHKHHENIETQQLNSTVQNKTNIISKDTVNIPRLKMIIANTKFRYEKLNEDLVSADAQGLHMATKIPCHAFFGEMIIKLQKNFENLSVSDFMQRILKLFCGIGAVDSDYCLKKKK